MSIELLYIIPVVALSLLLVINVVVRQRAGRNRAPTASDVLTREVEEFNVGKFVADPDQGELPRGRLGEIEKTITLVSQALSNQQKLIEGFKGANIGYTSEIDSMKSRLRELQREYDIILSENYSLRAKIRKLEQRAEMRSGARPAGREETPERVSGESSEITAEKQRFGDTELISDVDYGDTREWEVTS